MRCRARCSRSTGGDDGHGVRTLGRTLRAGRGNARDGEPAVLVVWPERIRLLPVDDAATDQPSTGQASTDGTPPAGNSVRGRVRQEIYLGSSRKLAVDLEDGTQVLVRESAGDISASRPGDEVRLTFRPQDAAVLPTTPAPASHGSDPTAPDNTPTRTANQPPP